MSFKTQSVERKTALCYIRLSVNKNGGDATSPERQRANILAACERYGWTPEWFSDTTGHRSAAKENNRPEWLRLKNRLNDPDVVALVVNEQSRAMRNALRALKLFEDLSNSGVKLHFAALDRSIDITTPDGRLSAYMQAFMDDLYVLDASRRAKDSVRYRKSKGVSVGIPPFGTVRDNNGYLTHSPFGCWLMPDGQFVTGVESDPAPDSAAVWRGFYDCAKYILEIYAEGQIGYRNIASRLNAEGWAYGNRYRQPVRVTTEAARRVISNWREYAGIITEGKARNRIAHHIENPTAILKDTGRAVFDLELLRKVAEAQAKRSRTTRIPGTNAKAHVFALSHLLVCACCQREAEAAEDATLNARIVGWKRLNKLRYRHSDSRLCASKRKSIPADVIERDFASLVDVLSVHPDALELMAELAVQAQIDTDDDPKVVEEKRQAAIAKHKRAIKSCLALCKAGDMDFADYERERDYHERQITHLEAQLTDRQQITLEFTSCAELLTRIQQFWNILDGEITPIS